MASKRASSTPKSVSTASLRRGRTVATNAGAASASLSSTFSAAARLNTQMRSGRGGRPSGNASAAARRTVAVRPSTGRAPPVARARGQSHSEARGAPRRMQAVEGGTATGRHRRRQLATGKATMRAGQRRGAPMQGVTAEALDKDLDSYMMSK